MPGNSALLLPNAPHFTLAAVTQAYCLTSGRTQEELAGKGLFEVFPPAADDRSITDGDQIQASLEQVLTHKEENRLAVMRYDIPTQDGSLEERYWSTLNKPVLNEQGEVCYIIHSAEDLTAQIKAQQRETSIKGLEKAYNLFMQVPDVVGFVKGDNHVLELANQSALALWGKGPDIIGRPLLEAIPELKGQGITELFEQVKQTGQSHLGKEVPVTTLVNGQEELHYFDFVYTPYFEEGDNQPTGVFTISHDVTEQVEAKLLLEQSQEKYRELARELERRVYQRTRELEQANQQLTHLNADLKRSNENLKQFAYVASHDLQEPLRKIQQFADILKQQPANALGDGVQYLERMQSAASRMSTLIKDLLTFSQISTQQDKTAPVALNQVLNAVLTDLEVRIQEAKAVVEVGPLPMVRGDQSQLGQLFQNLLGNALKFRQTSVAPILQVRAQRVDAADLPASLRPTRQATDYHCIEVTDNGIGFDERYVDRIFQVFQRLHGKSQYAGTGIGLAICQKVVANHGGAITARSQVGKGATFSVYLPAE